MVCDQGVLSTSANELSGYDEVKLFPLCFPNASKQTIQRYMPHI